MAAAVMIERARPHRASHTARRSARPEELVAWAAAWPQRAWAVEGASGLGYLLARQLVAAGEQVLDVQPKTAARVRLLGSGNTGKNDPNDARSVAVAALRSPDRRPVAAEDHTAVLKVWSRRYRDPGRARTQAACRLHAAGDRLGAWIRPALAAAKACLRVASPSLVKVSAA
jgi:hypothetical protein